MANPRFNDTAVRVDNVSKVFKLPHEKQTSLKGAFLGSVRQKKGYETQEALKDISFEVKKGEFFGIVGRNGSGKSTLLKCIAGVYTPSKGKIHINGTLVPFIELGVGFNPELSGRDNVFLNGALLGFSRKQMSKMYNEIVEFAELEQFMDQKLKNYSSGMQVRLAFSIAIKAEGDILLLDEVLAVGDVNFQKKCNDHFEYLKEQKKTVILVTHDMGAVQRYCTQAMIIEDGQVKRIGSPSEVSNQYSLDNLNSKSTTQANKNKSLNEAVKSLSVKPLKTGVLKETDSFKFEISYELNKSIDVDLGITIAHEGKSVLEQNTKQMKLGGEKGVTYRVAYTLPLKPLTAKQYTVDVAIFEKSEFKLIGFSVNACSFIVSRKDSLSGGVLSARGKWVVTEGAL